MNKSEGNKVAFQVTATMKHTGDFMGIPATGKTVTMTKKPRSQGLFGQMKNIVSSLFRKK